MFQSEEEAPKANKQKKKVGKRKKLEENKMRENIDGKFPFTFLQTFTGRHYKLCIISPSRNKCYVCHGDTRKWPESMILLEIITVIQYCTG